MENEFTKTANDHYLLEKMSEKLNKLKDKVNYEIMERKKAAGDEDIDLGSRVEAMNNTFHKMLGSLRGEMFG